MRRLSSEANFSEEPKENKTRYSVEDLNNDRKLIEIFSVLSAVLKSRKLPFRGSFGIEDIVQETLMTAREKTSQIKNRDDIIGWLTTIAINKLANETFRKKNSNNGIDFAEEVYPKDEEILKSLVNRQRANTILEKLEMLYKDSPDDIKIWKMRFLEEMNYKEIGEKVKKSEQALRTMIFRINESILMSLGYEKRKKNKNNEK